MNNDLIERYIYAATKRLNRKQRDDVARELRTLIEDMLTERCFGRIPEERDVRVVLTELGTPQELYSRYDEDADKCLIGQPYYSTYKFVLKIVLISVVAGMTIAHGLLAILEPRDLFTTILSWLNAVWNGLFSSFACVTLLFAWFQRKGVRVAQTFNFDDLPPVPKRTELIPKWEPIAGMVLCILFAVLFLFTPEVFCAIYDGKTVALFDSQALRDSAFLIIAFALCGIIREAVQLMEGRYNKKVLMAALATDAVSAGLSFWWLWGFDVMNQSFLKEMDVLFAGEADIVYRMLANFDSFFLGVLLFALVLDAVDVTIKTLKAKE